jgi:hypothetical protein
MEVEDEEVQSLERLQGWDSTWAQGSQFSDAIPYAGTALAIQRFRLYADCWQAYYLRQDLVALLELFEGPGFVKVTV